MRFKTYKIQGAAAMLDVSTDTVRRDCEEAGIEVQRQAGEGPKARLFTIDNIFALANFRRRKSGKKTRKQTVVTVYAPKGGVGKTTHTANLACVLALMGLRVLVIDLDFQSNLTIALGYDPELTEEEIIELNLPDDQRVDFHLGHLLPQWSADGNVLPLAKVLKKPYGEHGPHLIPSDVSFDRIEALFTLDTLLNKKPDMAIAKLLREGKTGKNPDFDTSGYDVILFDAPPAKNQATQGALLASDFVMAPVSMEKFSTKSVSYLAKVLGDMKGAYDKFPELVILGNFYDMNRARVASQVVKLNEKYPGAWLEKQVSTSEEFKKALSDEDVMPLVLSRPTSLPAAQLNAVARALLERMQVFQ